MTNVPGTGIPARLHFYDISSPVLQGFLVDDAGKIADMLMAAKCNCFGILFWEFEEFNIPCGVTAGCR